MIGRLRSPRAAPRDYAQKAISELLSAWVEPGSGLSTKQILEQIVTEQFDELAGTLKLQNRKGLAEEKRRLKEALVALAGRRVEELLSIPAEQRPEMLLTPDQLAITVLSNQQPGPIAAALWGRLATERGLNGIDSPELLALMTGPQASEQARETLASKIGRLARHEMLFIESRLSQNNVRPEEHSAISGFLRRGSEQTVLHILDSRIKTGPVTACGKSGAQLAEYGAWHDAEYGSLYRRCSKCQRSADQSLLNQAAAERGDLISAGQPPIIDQPVIQSALNRASVSQEFFAELKEQSPLRLFVDDDNARLRQLLGQELAAAVERRVADNLIVNAFWGKLDREHRKFLLNQGRDARGILWTVKDVLSGSEVQDLVRLAIEQRCAELGDNPSNLFTARRASAEQTNRYFTNYRYRHPAV